MPVTQVHSSEVDAEGLKSAYEEGRRDERARKKRHPFIMTMLFLLAIAGAALLTLAAVNGSFRDGGQMADANLAVAADRAAPVIEDAAVRTGEAAKQAARDAAANIRGDEPVATTTVNPAPAAQSGAAIGGRRLILSGCHQLGGRARRAAGCR